MTTAAHPLDNHHRAAGDHHAALAELLDPITRRRIDRLVSLPQTRRCLEVGAGAGSVAGWLAESISGTGEVVATDLKPEHLPPHPRLTAVQHDLTDEQPYDVVLGRDFDLIHARLTLVHLPQRHQILGRLAELLAPGGVLLIEDWAALRSNAVVAAPDPGSAELYARYQEVAARAFDGSGTDPTWAHRIHRIMLEAELTNVTTEIHGHYWTGGGPGLRIIEATLPQLRGKLNEGGFTDAELDQLQQLLSDPRLVVHGHPLYSCAGYKPAPQK